MDLQEMAEGFQEQGHIQSGMRKEKKRTRFDVSRDVTLLISIIN
jgi:hypothetical protein